MAQFEDTKWWHKLITHCDETKWWKNLWNKKIRQRDETEWWHNLITNVDHKNCWLKAISCDATNWF